MYKILFSVLFLLLVFSCKTSKTSCDAYGGNKTIKHYHNDSITFIGK